MTPDPGRPWLEVGRIVKAHGLTGEVVVHPISNVPGRFARGVVLRTADGTELHIVAARPHQTKVLVRFEGVADRNGAEALRGLLLRAEALPDAPAGELWVHELIGLPVQTVAGAGVGTVVAVVANPASDLLELDSGALIPMVFVHSHEPRSEATPGRIVIDPPEGLLDLTDRPGAGEAPPAGGEIPPPAGEEIPPPAGEDG